MSDPRTALARLLDVVDRCEPNHPKAVGDVEYDAARASARQALKSADEPLSDRDRLRTLLHDACDAISGEPGTAMDRCRQHLGDALALLALGDAPTPTPRPGVAAYTVMVAELLAHRFADLRSLLATMSLEFTVRADIFGPPHIEIVERGSHVGPCTIFSGAPADALAAFRALDDLCRREPDEAATALPQAAE